MPTPTQINVKPGDNLLLVGTTKGAFLFRSDAQRMTWDEAGPYFPGRSVYALAHDGRNGGSKLWAAVNSPYWGSFLSSSNDFGKTWNDIGKGLPSDFGFAMEIDPHNANTVYIIPIESDEFRCTPEGKLRVYRTKNGGESWDALTKGLPQEDALETILRDNMDADSNSPTGLYFGTRSGKVFGSSTGGDSWTLIKDGLPPVTCVKTAKIN